MYASAASWRARTADDWNLRSFLKSLAISLTSLWNGSFLMRSSVDFWNFLISLRANSHLPQQVESRDHTDS